MDADTWRAVAELEVAEHQRDFVAAPARYLALCAYGGAWHPLAVRMGERVIGFVMWAVDPDDGSCWLGGLLIDVRHQRQGHGRGALETLIGTLADVHGHHRFALSYRPDNPAKALYASLGFEETGEVEDDEVVARWTRSHDAAPAAHEVAATGRATVREATRDDLPVVVALLADDPLGANRERPGDPLDPAYAAAFDAMRAQGGNVLLVAEVGGEVVGCLQLVVVPGVARVGMARAHVEGVRVARAHRRRRVGEVLLEAAVARATEAGCGLVQLTTDVSRTDAKRFYERIGFRATHHGMKRALR